MGSCLGTLTSSRWKGQSHIQMEVLLLNVARCSRVSPYCFLYLLIVKCSQSEKPPGNIICATNSTSHNWIYFDLLWFLLTALFSTFLFHVDEPGGISAVISGVGPHLRTHLITQVMRSCLWQPLESAMSTLMSPPPTLTHFWVLEKSQRETNEP
jgi:hypothetical protein